MVSARPPLPSQVMRADWARGYATMEEPTSSTATADSGGSVPDFSPSEHIPSSNSMETTVEVSDPAATVHSELSIAAAITEQVVPAPCLPPKEIQVPVSTATPGIASTKDGSPPILTRLAQYIRSSRTKKSGRSHVQPQRCPRLVCQDGVGN